MLLSPKSCFVSLSLSSPLPSVIKVPKYLDFCTSSSCDPYTHICVFALLYLCFVACSYFLSPAFFSLALVDVTVPCDYLNPFFFKQSSIPSPWHVCLTRCSVLDTFFQGWLSCIRELNSFLSTLLVIVVCENPLCRCGA